MRAIKQKNTDAERMLRRLLTDARIVGYRRNPKLPGRPDVVFLSARIAVFVDGCCWHGCDRCEKVPASHVDYWGTIGPDARRYANKIMADSNLCIVMINRSDLDNIRINPVFIVNAFNREAQHAMTLKKLDL